MTLQLNRGGYNSTGKSDQDSTPQGKRTLKSVEYSRILLTE
jgi:hypothetical protein